MKNTVRLIGGLPKRELVEKIRFHHRQGEIAERALGFYLLDMQRRREFRPGFRSAARWAEKKLGTRCADRLILTAKRIEKLPAIDGAFARGEIPWTKAREIARVATVATEGEWLEFARSKTCREVERAVARARRGDLPASRLGTPRPHRVVRVPVSSEENVLWETAVRKIREKLGKGTTPRDALRAMCERVLRENAVEEADGSRSPYTVVYHVGPDGKSAWMDTPSGRLEVSLRAVEEKLRAGARSIEARDIEGAGDCPAIGFHEHGSAQEEERDRPVSPEVREAVLARDSHRCLVCGRSRDLMVHHLDSRAHGGRSVMERLVTLCGPCHGEVHEQEVTLRIEDDGSLSALDRDGELLAGGGLASEAVEEVETVLEAAPAEDAGGSEESSEEIPAQPRGKPAARPASFDDFVGQRRVVENLRLAARAAEARGEVLGHVLLSGPPGLGKTTLARLLAAERGVGFEEIVASQVGDPRQLVAILEGLAEGDVLFIDEIHALKEGCAEAIYSALEDGGGNLVPFTLVGATTRPGALPEPFRARFAVQVHLEPYTEEELAEVVGKAAGRLGVSVSSEAAREIARRGRGTPREALRLLGWARDLAQVDRLPRRKWQSNPPTWTDLATGSDWTTWFAAMWHGYTAGLRIAGKVPYCIQHCFGASYSFELQNVSFSLHAGERPRTGSDQDAYESRGDMDMSLLCDAVGRLYRRRPHAHEKA